MTRLHRNINIVAVFLPFIAVIAAIVVFWNRGVTWVDLALLAGMYVLTGFGITVGYHRMLTHRAFQTSKPVEYTFAVLGSMALQGPVISWVADHRKHHAHTDQEGDPHSPHAGFSGGSISSAVAGCPTPTSAGCGSTRAAPVRASTRPTSSRIRACAASAARFRGSRWRRSPSRRCSAGLITMSWWGALTGLLWGGFVRVFFLHHVTWSINSVCHFLGRRPFEVDDHSGNVAWLALPSFGEAYHHNHHAFPRSAAHGMQGRRQIDLSAGLIWTLEKLGLVWNVVRISPERQAQKLARPAQAQAAETRQAA